MAVTDEMVEAAARAICACDRYPRDLGLFDRCPPDVQESFRVRARAALEAAEAVRERDVSEAMIRAGARILTGEIAATCCHTTGGRGNGTKHCCCRSAAVDVYHAMIAAGGDSE